MKVEIKKIPSASLGPTRKGWVAADYQQCPDPLQVLRGALFVF
ncbi:hypothetical protein L585_14885 [Pantoea ananatis BRT175]|nr:hypothetical protein L585_14885 [Pantoea ananatis BRT175]